MYLSYLLTWTIFNFSNMEKKRRNHACENSHLSSSPSSAPQVTFRQATRGVSNENGLCQARHMARYVSKRIFWYMHLYHAGG